MVFCCCLMDSSDLSVFAPSMSQENRRSTDYWSGKRRQMCSRCRLKLHDMRVSIGMCHSANDHCLQWEWERRVTSWYWFPYWNEVSKKLCLIFINLPCSIYSSHSTDRFLIDRFDQQKKPNFLRAKKIDLFSLLLVATILYWFVFCSTLRSSRLSRISITIRVSHSSQGFHDANALLFVKVNRRVSPDGLCSLMKHLGGNLSQAEFCVSWPTTNRPTSKQENLDQPPTASDVEQRKSMKKKLTFCSEFMFDNEWSSSNVRSSNWRP